MGAPTKMVSARPDARPEGYYSRNQERRLLDDGPAQLRARRPTTHAPARPYASHGGSSEASPSHRRRKDPRDDQGSTGLFRLPDDSLVQRMVRWRWRHLTTPLHSDEQSDPIPHRAA